MGSSGGLWFTVDLKVGSYSHRTVVLAEEGEREGGSGGREYSLSAMGSHSEHGAIDHPDAVTRP